MTNKRLIMLTVLAVVLVGISCWVHLAPGETGYRVPMLTADDLAALKPDVAGDMRLLEELRRQLGAEPDAWSALPTCGQAVFATLWAEEIQRNGTWAQLTEVEEGELHGPSLRDAAAGYEALGLADAARAVRSLAERFERDRDIVQAWVAAMKAGARPPRPDMKPLDTAARAAFSRLDTVRTRRLEYVRSNAAELAIH